MLENLLKQEEEFQPYLLPKDYSFIGPVNQNLLEQFIKVASRFTPAISITKSVHHVLSNKRAVRKVLNILPPRIPIKIYAVTSTGRSLLVHSDIKTYCIQNNIEYPLTVPG